MKLIKDDTITVIIQNRGTNPIQSKSITIYDTNLMEVYDLIRNTIENQYDPEETKNEVFPVRLTENISIPDSIKTDLIRGKKLSPDTAFSNYVKNPQKLVFVLTKLLVKNGNVPIDRDALQTAYLSEVGKSEGDTDHKWNPVDWFSARLTSRKHGVPLGDLNGFYTSWELLLARGKKEGKYTYSIKKEYFEKVKGILNEVGQI